jgi:DNA replication protein DnaC
VQAICTKAREVIVEDYLAGAGFPERFLRLKLADLDESDAKKRALSYVERFNECKREGKGLVIAGGVGTGKTQLMTSLGLELIERYVFVSITFTTCHKFLQLHREAMQDDMAQEELDSIYYDSDLVLIDDIGANRFSDYDIAVFGNFIDERYSKLLPVVLTTNLDIRDLEECVGERVISRLKEMCEVVLLTGEDRRGKLRSAPSTDER